MNIELDENESPLIKDFENCECRKEIKRKLEYRFRKID